MNGRTYVLKRLEETKGHLRLWHLSERLVGNVLSVVCTWRGKELLEASWCVCVMNHPGMRLIYHLMRTQTQTVCSS